MKMKHLSYAVTLAMGASLAPQLAQASHESELLFPYVVKDTNRTTVITLIADGQSVSSGASIHLQYWTKSTTAANTAACEPNSSAITFTDNDIATWDTAGLLGTGALFGDTTNLAPLGASISYAGPRHGYLLVADINDSNNLKAGYWAELDLANGGAHGDFAARGNGNSGAGYVQDLPNTLSLNTGSPNSSINGGNNRAVGFWPASVASTVFTVTPLGANMETSDNNVSVVQIFNDSPVQGAYDRNENGIDGTVPQTVRCVGRLTLAQLMPGVVLNAAWAAQGGWGWFNNLSGGSNQRALVYQVDTSNAAGTGKFMSNAVRLVGDDGDTE